MASIEHKVDIIDVVVIVFIPVIIISFVSVCVRYPETVEPAI